MTRPLLCLSTLLLLIGCGQPSAPPVSEAAPNSATSRETPREIRVSPEMQKKWGLVTGPVERLTVTGAVTLPGIIALNQQRTALITSLIEGRVTSIGADLGDQVRAGQVLVVLHSPALAQAQTAFLQASARRAVARRELDRARELLKDEAIQQKEVLRRQAEFDAATTEYGAAESSLHSLGWDHPQLDALLQRASRGGTDLSDLVDPTLTIRAPVDGRVITRDVVAGEHVHPDKLLFTVSDLSTVWALLDAREKDLPGLTAGGRVAITGEVYGTRSFEGRLTRIGDVVDEKLRTIKLRVELPNPGLALKPNMFVQGALELHGGTREVLGVPEDAVQTIQGEPAVFVVGPGGGFSVKPVVIGERIGTKRAVTSGLDGREVVVVAGAFNLKAELLKSSFAGE
jgi:cobalt-zinc-cadmium efflux system membrane fusion protein